MERKKRILTKNLDRKMRRRRRIRIGVTTFLLLFLVLVGACFGIGEYLVMFAVGPSDGMPNLDPGAGGEPTEDSRIVDSNTESFDKLTTDWVEETKPTTIHVTSDDDLQLTGFYYPSKTTSHDYALLLHGYRSDHESMENLAYFYGNVLGFNCLLPDMRACGESEGEYVGMGYLDSQDVLKWVDWIDTRDQDARILISGVSMGGATTMMVSGLDALSDSVVAFVEDCGYTSVWDIFEHELDFLFHLPAFPLLYCASAISDFQVGYSFKEASSIDALHQCEKPMLFIHGKEDTFVSYDMLDAVYQAKTNGVKEKLTVEGAGHGESYLRNPSLYFTTVKDFLVENTDFAIDDIDLSGFLSSFVD